MVEFRQETNEAGMSEVHNKFELQSKRALQLFCKMN